MTTRHPIERVWAECSSVVINRKLTDAEVARLLAVGRQPEHVVDLYGNGERFKQAQALPRAAGF